MDFMTCLENEASKTLTENGAVGYSTSGKAMVDFNFRIPSYRRNRADMVNDLSDIIAEKDPYLFKYLFYLRDCREGLGERDTFRKCILKALQTTKLSNEEKEKIIFMIPVYGRWDDVTEIFTDTEFEDFAYNMIKEQLAVDEAAAERHESISLMAKWLPSDNASSKRSRYIAHKLANYMGMTVKTYRRTLVELRRYLDVTEVKACGNNWSEIDYNKVSSNANIRYRNAFMEHDRARREEYLAALVRGDSNVVMHSATNFPHDIVHQYVGGFYGVAKYDEAIEQLWKNLPDMPGLDNTLVIRDGSGSMTCSIPNSSVTAMNVADAMTLYCADRCSGNFKDTFITFSSRPQLVSVVGRNSLHDKLEKLHTYTDCSNTNLEATFNLILRTAVNGNIAQEEMPKRVLVISDMEFDSATYSYGKQMETLMETITKKFADAGYKLPKLVFWNVNSRTNTMPMKENELGVILVSGFSVNTIKLVLSGKLDPYEALIDALSVQRYEEIPLARY